MSAVACNSFYFSFRIAARSSIGVETASRFKASYSACSTVTADCETAVTASSANTYAACSACSCVAAVSVATSASCTSWG